jgi:hypothetical protein
MGVLCPQTIDKAVVLHVFDGDCFPKGMLRDRRPGGLLAMTIRKLLGGKLIFLLEIPLGFLTQLSYNWQRIGSHD